MTTSLRSRRSANRKLAVFGGLAALYCLFGLGHDSVTAGNPTLAGFFWPGAGLAVAALLVAGIEFWPAIALGKLASEALLQNGLFSVTSTVGSTAGVVVAALFLRRQIRLDRPFHRLSEVPAMILAATGGAGVSAGLVVGLNVALGLASWPSFGSHFLQWWRGDAMGILVVTPVVLAWSRPRRVRGDGYLLALTTLAAAALSYLVFGATTSRGVISPLAFLVFPIIIWSALRFGPRGAATTAFAAIVAACFGPVSPDSAAAWLVLWAFMAVLIVTAIAMAAILAEKQASETQLRQAQKMEAVGQLAAGVAHDFNNLLTVIVGNAEEAASQPGSTADVAARLNEITGAAERAAALTGQLLAFSRLEISQPRTMAVDPVVGEAQRMLERLINKNIELEFTAGAGGSGVFADPAQMQQIVLNLAVNARDAMPHGGRLSMATGVMTLDDRSALTHPEATPGTYVVIEVRDTGIGMDADTRLRIFEPFFTTKELGKGTGLGLATVYGIVKQMSGFIEVDSAPGEGTSFRVYLPRVAAAPAEHDPAPAAGVPGSPGSVILLAEDEDSVRLMVHRYLESQGHTVLSARNGTEALALWHVRDRPPDLLVTDVVMPSMGGPELASALRARFSTLRVLYVSGYNNEAMLRRGTLPAGAAFLQKPFTPRTLGETIATLLKTAIT